MRLHSGDFMIVELTEIQVQMLQALLDRTLLANELSTEDANEYYDMYASLDVDHASLHFDADSTDCLSGISLSRVY